MDNKKYFFLLQLL